MQNGRFVVLTGHLNDYPLADLVGILRHQRKTGRLTIEYPQGPATFHFQEGELVDAQMNNLGGLQAICVALAQPPSSFNFNPLIRGSRRSIDRSLQRVVSEMLGCWDENALEIETEAAEQKSIARSKAPTHELPQTQIRPALALSPSGLAADNNSGRTRLAVAAAVVIMVGLSTLVAVTGGFGAKAVLLPEGSSKESAEPGKRTQEQTVSPATSEVRDGSTARNNVPKGRDATANSEQTRKREEPNSRTKGKETASQIGGSVEKNPAAVNVVVQIENGRVLQASVANHRPGMEGYEALALRIARQRRFPATTNGKQTVSIRVGQ